MRSTFKTVFYVNGSKEKSGIIQQYKKVLSRLPEPEERDGEDKILSSKCGMYDGRKIAACDLWAGNAETQRWFRKR